MKGRMFFWLGMTVLFFFRLNAQIDKQMIYIPGGTFVMGGGYQYSIQDYRMVYIGTDPHYAETNDGTVSIGEIPASNNPDKMEMIQSFYMSSAEVSQFEYRDYMIEFVYGDKANEFRNRIKKAEKKGEITDQFWKELFTKAAEAGILPDTNCWAKDFAFSYNEPMVKFYFQHPAFDNYPVVGVSWKQANMYCEWLTKTTNEMRKNKGMEPLPAYRLPTEAEWEYAAKGVKTTSVIPLYPWTGYRLIDEKGQWMANIKTDPSDYVGDNYEYTAPLRSFKPNVFGLYDMAGNVAEWTQDVFVVNGHEFIETPESGTDGNAYANTRVIKGGSWAEYRYGAMCGSRTFQDENKGTSRTGFRVARSAK